IDTDAVVGDTIIDVSGKKMTIAEFYDSTPDVFMRRNDEARDWVKRVGGKTSLSVNTYSGEVERKNINYIMKHTVKKRMFKIKAGGKEVIVTADHSVMVKRDGKIIDVKPTEMKQTDRVVKWMLTGSHMIEFIEFEIEDLGVMEIDVYDIEVDGNHNFFGNDILVHASVYLNKL
uniref:DNA-directed DNA polymerase n=1 Tax=Aeromonas phage Aes123 TaxID=1198018 RepID=UPI003CDF86F8